MAETIIERVVSIRRGARLESVPGKGSLAQRLQATYGVTILVDLPTGHTAIVSFPESMLQKLQAELGAYCYITLRRTGTVNV